MGVKDLMKIIRKDYSHVIHTIHISHFARKRLAIDTSSFMFRYKSVFQDNWMNGFIEMIRVFRKNQVHCVFVLDGVAGAEKDKEKQERREKREKLRERINMLEMSVADYHESGVVNDTLKEFQKRRKIEPMTCLFSEEKDGVLNIKEIEYAIEKLKQQDIQIGRDDYNNLKTLFELFGVPCLQAEKEAETLCCDLFLQGIVTGVCSEDADVFCYKADKLGSFNTSEETVELIEYKSLLEEMELTDDQFLDFCIMCGVDYNERIPKIGIVKSLKFIKEHNNIETIRDKFKMNVDCLNHIQIRGLFRDYPKFTGKVSYCDTPKWLQLQEFFFTKNIKMNLGYIKKSIEVKLTVA